MQPDASPERLVASLRAGASPEALAGTCRGLPRMHVGLVAAGATPHQLGQAMGDVTDALTRRLLELAQGELGAPPVPYTWIACGSQARQEQTSLSDQDNVLLLADEYRPREHAPYFRALAGYVNDALDACGFPYCPGEVMARNPCWCQPLSGWQRHFDGWVDEPSPLALMHVSIFFDMRAVAGDETALRRLQAHVRRKVRGNEIFLAYLAANALQHRPPLGLFGRFLRVRAPGRPPGVDLKHGGLVPLVDLARLGALATGGQAVNTLERLREAALRHALSPEGAADLADAFVVISTLRARHQARQLERGLCPDNLLEPRGLPRPERQRLKRALRVIGRHQALLAHTHQAGRFR